MPMEDHENEQDVNFHSKKKKGTYLNQVSSTNFFNLALY